LALFTLALVIVGGLQARRLRQTVEATKEAAQAAKKSADVAERTLSLTNRPWLEVTDWELMNLTPDATPFVQFKIRNFGKSPAWITRLQVKFTTINVGTDFPEIPDYTNRANAGFRGMSGRMVQPDTPNSGRLPFRFG
jgi:hypothetical protein